MNYKLPSHCKLQNVTGYDGQTFLPGAQIMQDSLFIRLNQDHT
jgi:hypothetical protein